MADGLLGKKKRKGGLLGSLIGGIGGMGQGLSDAFANDPYLQRALMYSEGMSFPEIHTELQARADAKTKREREGHLWDREMNLERELAALPPDATTEDVYKLYLRYGGGGAGGPSLGTIPGKTALQRNAEAVSAALEIDPAAGMRVASGISGKWDDTELGGSKVHYRINPATGKPEYMTITGEPIEDVIKFEQEQKAKAAGGVVAAQELARNQQEAANRIEPFMLNAQRTLGYLDSIREHPGLDIATGWTSILSSLFAPGSEGADFEARLQTPGGQQFLLAYEGLRGGGTITEVETAQAKTALGNLSTAQSKEQFLEALDEFEAAVINGYNMLVVQLPKPARGAYSMARGKKGFMDAFNKHFPDLAPETEPQRIRVYNPDTGKFEWQEAKR